MRERHQGGWIANFVIVGALLVLGLIGAIYFLKSQGTNGSDEIATEETQHSTEDDTKTQSSEEKKNSQADVMKKDREAKDKESSSKTEESSKSKTVNKDDSDKQSAEQSDLPATGPAETMQAVIGLSILTFSASAYIQSRRARRL